jgi:transposase
MHERAVRLVFEQQGEYDSQWEAIESIAAKVGCSAEALRKWVRKAEHEKVKKPAAATPPESARVAELEREVRELRRANEILRKASAYFAQAELDRRPK